MSHFESLVDPYVIVEPENNGGEGNNIDTQPQANLAEVLLFTPWTLYDVRQKLQDRLTAEYLCGLKPWDEVEIWLERMMPYHTWTVVSNQWDIVKIQAACYCNKNKKEWIRSFSTVDGYSKGFLFLDDYWDNIKTHYYILIPYSHRVSPIIDVSYELIEALGPKTI